MTEKSIFIPARLKSVVVNGHVTGTADIIDDIKGKTQDVVNQETDTAIETLQEDVATNAAAITTEKERAEGVEQQLQTDLNAEVTRAKAAEKTNAEAISAETTRATGKESELNTAISNEATTARAAEKANANAITTETNRAKGVEEGIDTRLTTVEGKVSEDASSTNKLVDKKYVDDADKVNTDAVSAETTRAKAAESTNASNITKEETRAKSAESTLQTAIDTETSDRTDADTALEGKINTLSSTVTSNKTATDKAIADEVSRAKSAESGLSSNISTTNTNLSNEISRATAKENAIESVVNIINGSSTVDGSFRKAIADLIGGAPEALDTLKEIADKLAEDDDLHAVIESAIALKADQTALDAVISRVSSLEGGSATSIETTGTGNAITAITKSGTKITATKGATFLTSHQSLADYLKKTDASGTYLSKTDAASTYQPKGNYLTEHQSLEGYVNSITTTGTGNAVTSISKSGSSVTVTKGASYLTSHQDISGKADKSTTLDGYGITNAYTKAQVDEMVEDVALHPVDISTLTPTSTFQKNAVIGINGTLYRATKATSTMPITLVVQDGAFVTETINGKTAYVVSSETLNDGWEQWTDKAVEYWIESLTASVNGKQDTISDLATIRTGAGKGATAYQKPTAGIPSTDMTSAVQASLAKADSALQSHQDISGKADKATTLAGYGITDAKIESGKITLGSNSITPLTTHQSLEGKSDTTHTHSVKINGVTKTIAATGGTAVDLGTYLTTHQDISGKADKATTLSGYGITDAYTKTEVDTKLGKKQDTISDLATIRSNASSAVKPTDQYTVNGVSYTVTELLQAVASLMAKTIVTQ